MTIREPPWKSFQGGFVIGISFKALVEGLKCIYAGKGSSLEKYWLQVTTPELILMILEKICVIYNYDYRKFIPFEETLGLKLTVWKPILRLVYPSIKDFLIR